MGRVLKVLALASEAGLTLVLVGIFFSIVMGILTVGFPEGTTLAQAILPGTLGGTDSGATPRALVVAGGEAAEPEAVLASISSIGGRVMDKSPAAITWSDSSAGTELANRHTVRTMRRSTATVTFRGDRELLMRESSMIVVRSRLPGLRRRESALIVLEGELRGRLRRAGEDEGGIVVYSPSLEALVRPADDSEEGAELSVKVNPDETSTVSVYGGSVEVQLAEGLLEIGADEFLTLSGEAPAETGTLPSPPVLDRPAPGFELPYSSVSTSAGFGWSGDESSTGYEIVIARDPAFEQIVLSEQVTEPFFDHGHLRSGTYHWRVSAFNGWAQSEPSEPRSFTVLRDREPPELVVGFPGGVVREESFVLTGRTEPGAEVYVGETRLGRTETGEFEHTLRLHPGLNVVVVSAVDQAGNVAHASEIVNAKF